MNPKKALGRGLDALISAPGPEPRRVLEVEVHRLHPNPKQPRTQFDNDHLGELAQSISENGVLQPILVRPHDGGYEIIAGERRWRAAQKAGLQKVPVLIKEVADAQLLELALVENLQREDLNPVEEARAYRVLTGDIGLTQEEVAARVGKDRATVANMLRLLNLSERALEALEAQMISVGHAKAILARRRRDEQDTLLAAIVAKGLSVRAAETYQVKPQASRAGRKEQDPDTREAATRVSRLVGLPVEIRRKKAGGEMAIRFRNEQELQHLFEWLHGDSRRT